MSGTKTNRTDLENRFKKGMYPTENDFANVFASYVHKDDTITLSQITLEEGGDNLGEVIDSKADKQTLETFVREVETVLETTRDSETGAITNSAINSLAQRITDAENDIASAANAVETNEDSIAKILTILGKQNGESVSELASRFSALSGDYATVFAFVSKVKTFLESADIADTTINRWQEIEAFLQGITDTETLTGLLQQMKQEILAEIPTPQPQPSGNYLELVDDLDAYTDAPDGKIVKYVGQTNEKYTRGFDYERVSTPLPQGQFCITLNGEITSDAQLVIQSRTFIKSNERLGSIYYGGARFLTGSERQIEVGDTVFIKTEGLFVLTDIDGTLYKLNDGRQIWSSTAPRYEDSVIYRNAEGFGIVTFSNYNESSYMNSPSFDQNEDILVMDKNENKHYVIVESLRIGSTDNLVDNTWQPIPSFNVIN